MSKYAEFPTTLTDGGHLAAALKAMGFEIECHEAPQTLFGYHGDARPEKATIIIRQNHTGIAASNDIGFVQGTDGTYRAIISAYDESVKFNATWMGQLKQEYTAQRQIAVGRTKGWTYQGRETVKLADGREQVRLQFKGR